MTTKKKKDSRSARTQVDSAGQESALQGKGASSKNVRESEELKTYRTQFKTVLMILHLKKNLMFLVLRSLDKTRRFPEVQG